MWLFDAKRALSTLPLDYELRLHNINQYYYNYDYCSELLFSNEECAAITLDHRAGDVGSTISPICIIYGIIIIKSNM